MIRFIHCVKRHPDISVEEFRRHWNSRQFADLLARMGAVTKALRMRKNLTLMVDMNQELMQQRGSEEPFDGIIEAWWDSAQVFGSLPQITAKMQTIQPEMERFQAQFIDFSQSRRFFTEWDET